MTTVTVKVTSEQQWLAARALDVTSTESAALFGLSPYLTEFELWHRKRENYVEAIEQNERMRWGNRLQDAIAAGVAEDHGWRVARFADYMRDPADRIGSSFDFFAQVDGEDGLLEIKNVDRLAFFDGWLDGDRGLEAPQHIEMQVQHQLEVSGQPWCALVALVGGNEARLTIRKRDRAIGSLIRQRVRAFWQSVDAGTPPKPDYDRDAEFLAKHLYGKADANLVLDADGETEELIAEYHRLGAAEKSRAAVKARILERIGTASKVTTPFGSLSCGETAPSEGTLVTADMVGTRIGARAGFRQFRFNPKKIKSTS